MARKYRGRMFFKSVSLMLAHLLLASQVVAGSSAANVETKGYPVFSDLAKDITPSKIIEILEDKMILSLAEVIDLANAHTTLGNTSRSLAIIRNVLRDPLYEQGRADLLKLHAITLSIQAGNQESKDKQQADYLLALASMKEAYKLSPSLDVANHIYGIAYGAGDALEMTAAEDLIRRLDPDAEGVEVLEPVTGVLIVVALGVAAVLATMYFSPDSVDSKVMIEAFAAIAAIAAAGLTVMNTVASQS